jgi:hypothetical protein
MLLGMSDAGGIEDGTGATGLAGELGAVAEGKKATVLPLG